MAWYSNKVGVFGRIVFAQKELFRDALIDLLYAISYLLLCLKVFQYIPKAILNIFVIRKIDCISLLTNMTGSHLAESLSCDMLLA